MLAIKYRLNHALLLTYVYRLVRATDSNNPELIKKLFDKSKAQAKKTLELCPTESTKEYIKSCIDLCDEAYETFELIDDTKKHYFSLSMTLGINTRDVPNLILGTYEMAISQLHRESDYLREAYQNNGTLPRPLRRTIEDYVSHKLTKEQTVQKLSKLELNVKKYLWSIGFIEDNGLER